MRRILPLVLAPLVATQAAAQRVTPAFVARIDSAVPALLRENRTPGASVAIVEGGRIVLERGYGFANLATGAPLTARTRLNVASVSKPVTAWGALRLAREGRLPLDAPIGRFTRRWRLADGTSPADSVTARRILSHTAGLSISAVPWFPADSAAPTLEALLSGRAGDRGPLRIDSPLGTWRYSGGGYTLLQLAMEETAGMRFEDWMARNVLRSLGMESTFDAPDAATAVGYDEEGKPVPRLRYVGASAGGLLASAHDFARLMRAYGRAWSGADRRVLRRAELEEMARPVAPVKIEGVETPGATYGLGHGTHRAADGRLFLYHSGGNPGARAYLIVSPDRGDGLFVAVNSDNGIPVVVRLVQIWGAAHGGDLPPLF